VFRERAKTIRALLFVLDAACICVAFAAAFALRFVHDDLPFLQRIPSGPWPPTELVRSEYAALLVASAVSWVIAIRRSGIYTSPRLGNPRFFLPAYTRALLWVVIGTGTVVFALKLQSISRIFFVYYFCSFFVLIVTKQMLLARAFRQLRRNVWHKRHALVIGSGRLAAWFCQVVRDAAEAGYELVGVVDPCHPPAGAGVKTPVLGTGGDLDTVLANYPIDEVFIVGSAEEIAGLGPLAGALIRKGRIVSLVSSMSTSADGVSGRITEFSGVPMISFGPMPKNEIDSGMKRVVDIVASAVALFVLMPVFLTIAGLLKLFDPGPVFFAQDRLGVGGHRFRLYKFRSMRVNAEAILKSNSELYQKYVANDYKLPDKEDPRVTRLGRFLRRTSLDELPQLWNVLQGHMSLVGPRPIVPTEIEAYEPYADLLLSTRPGITGIWQISGRSVMRYPDRAFLDLDYVGNHSISSDISIIARTVPAVLRRRGAH